MFIIAELYQKTASVSRANVLYMRLFYNNMRYSIVEYINKKIVFGIYSKEIL